MGWVRCGLGIPSSVLSLPTPSEASGSIARFNTDLTENLLSAVAEFSASQAEGIPTPVSSIPIVGVDKVLITDCSKNLCPNKTYERNAQNVRLGVDTLDGRLKYKAGTYTISLICPLSTSLFYSSNGVNTNINATTIGTKRVATFTLSEDTELFFYAYNTSGLTSADISELQLEFGSTATDYEPYNGTTALINLGGTYFGGYIDAVTGKITLTRGALMPTGSDFTIYSSGVFYCDIPANYRGDNFRFSTLGSHFKRFEGGWASMPDQNFQAYNRLGIRYDAYTTKEDFQNWVDGQISANTPLVFVFPLVNPIVVYASNTAEIPTIVGDNQVFADSGNIAVEFLETVGHKI